MDFNCPNCKNRQGIITNSYKHHWITCRECGTVTRQRKDHYRYDNWLTRFIIRNTKLNRVYGHTLLPIKEVIQEEKRFYDYYYDIAKKGIKGTKWEAGNKKILSDLKRFGIELSGKTILDISGGPGFLTQEVSRVAKRAVVTEFSQYAVDGMSEALRIEGVKFDYNKDRIDQCVDGKFDVILIAYSVGFCNDLEYFLRHLKNLMHENSVVYISYSPPTLGLMIRWQFDEYTYTTCWPVDAVIKQFGAIGMKEVARDNEGSYPYDMNWFQTKNKNPLASYFLNINKKIGNSYLELALQKDEPINKELVQKDVIQVFKFL